MLDTHLIWIRWTYVPDILKASLFPGIPYARNVLYSRYDCVYLHPKILPAALLAAGSAVEITDAVINGKARNAFGNINCKSDTKK